MRLLLGPALFWLAFATGVGATPAPQPAPAAPAPATGYVLIKLAEGAVPPPGAEPIFGGWYRVAVTPGRAPGEAMADLRDRPGVVGVYLDTVFSLPVEPSVAAPPAASPPALFPPNDPQFGRQWHMPQIGLEAAWAITTGADVDTGDGVVVAVIDTGVARGGPDGFCEPLHSEYNAITNATGTGAANDGHSHGTHVAGTIANCADNGIGVVGVAPAAQIMAVKVLADSGNGSFSDVAEGIVWAADHGARVLNLSLGSDCTTTWPGCSTPIVNDAIDYAAAADVVVVFSAGNGNRPFVGQPGNHPEAIAVAATDYARARSPYSNRGDALSIAAPGGNSGADLNGDGFSDGVLQETRQGNTWGYYYKSGTSMAAPHVAGAAALLRACVPEADRDAVRSALEEYSLDLGAAGKDSSFGHGFLQADAALAALAYAFGRDPEAACAPTSEPPPCFTLATTVDGPGTLTVEPPPDCDPDGEEPIEPTAYTFGTRLTLTADPDDGFLFTGWSDDAGGTNNPLSLRITRDLDVTAHFAPPPPPLHVAVSLKTNGSAGGIAYTDEDVLADDPDDGLSLWFDGSAHGLAAEDVDGLVRLADGALLLSLDSPAKNLPGLGTATVDDSDVIRYNPATGQYAWYFDGSDVALTTAAEDVDALALLPDGRLLISTTGAVKVTGVNAADEDVLAFNGTLGSDTTTGTWSLYFDGSDVSANLGDVDGLAYSPGLGGGPVMLLLSADTAFTLGGVSMAPGDVFACEPITLGSTTRCDTSRFWQGTANGLAANANVDAVEVYLP